MIDNTYIFARIKPGAKIKHSTKMHVWPDCYPPQYEHNKTDAKVTAYPERVFLALLNKETGFYNCIADGYGFMGIGNKVITQDRYITIYGRFGCGSITVFNKEDLIEATYQDYLTSLELTKSK